MGACIQRYGEAGRGGIGTDGIMREGPQKQPGQQPDVGDTLNEFFRSVREERTRFGVTLGFSLSFDAQRILSSRRD